MSDAKNPSQHFKPRHVPCPACKGQSLYSSTNPYRPFCSARCKGVDLGAWASEEFKLPDAPSNDEHLDQPRLP